MQRRSPILNRPGRFRRSVIRLWVPTWGRQFCGSGWTARIHSVSTALSHRSSTEIPAPIRRRRLTVCAAATGIRWLQGAVGDAAGGGTRAHRHAPGGNHRRLAITSSHAQRSLGCMRDVQKVTVSIAHRTILRLLSMISAGAQMLWSFAARALRPPKPHPQLALRGNGLSHVLHARGNGRILAACTSRPRTCGRLASATALTR